MDSSSDWRTTNRGSVARAQYLLHSGQWSDCEFLVGQPPSQELVAAHKLYLVSSSPVFEAMFFGSISPGNKPIQVPDIEAGAFRAMLEFIYTDRLPSLHLDLALDLCYCANKYMLPDLAEKCTKCLFSNITPQTVCEIYRHAKLFEQLELVEKCLKLMCTETRNVLTCTSWPYADRSTVSVLLDQKYLAIHSELVLYRSLLVWCKAECARKHLPVDKKSLRSVAGQLLGKIRFSALTPEEFTNGPAKGEILEPDEILAIYMNMFSGDSSTPMPEGFAIERTGRLGPNGDEKIGCATGTSVFLSLPIPAKTPQNSDKAVECYCYRDFSPTCNLDNRFSKACHLSFRVDASIQIVGLLVPTQVSSKVADSSNTYFEYVFARLYDPIHRELDVVATYSGSSPYNKILVMRFNRPMITETHRDYRIDVTFNQRGIYPLGAAAGSATCEHVRFTFYHEHDTYNHQDQLIRGIVFRK